MAWPTSIRARSVDLDSLVPRADYRIIYGGPFTTIAPAAGKEEAVARALAGRHGAMNCWPKAQVPARYHYGSNARIPAIVCLADLGWNISQGPQTRTEKGAHGFDPDTPDMGRPVHRQRPGLSWPQGAGGDRQCECLSAARPAGRRHAARQ